MRSISILLFFLSLAGYSYSQAPANDDYAGAVTLVVNPAYDAVNSTAGTTLNATQSSTATCKPGANDDDVWYKFTATRASHIVQLSSITSGNNSFRAYGIEVFSSEINGLAERVNCTENGASYPSLGEALLTGLTTGGIYYVRVYGFYTWSGVPDRINFNIAILTPPNPPVNDEIAGAISLSVNQGYTETGTISGTTDGATLSSPATCMSGDNDDVWYKFTATHSSHIVRLSSIAAAHGSIFDSMLEVFANNGGQAGERVLCRTTGGAIHEGLLTGLMAGQTYFVRVYSGGSYNGVAPRINFNITILTPPNPPANDEIAGAVTLVVNQGYACGSPLAGTTDGATMSQQAACKPGANDDDVWYKFTAARASHIVRLSAVALAHGSSQDNVIEVFANNGGQPGNRILCHSAGGVTHEGLLTGLTTGETYFVRVYALNDYNGRADRIHFNICLLSPVYPPANDESAAAAALTPDATNNCSNTMAGTTDGATQSTQEACNAGENDDDVWYSFIATQPAHTVRLSNVVIAYGDTRSYTVEVFRKTEGVPGARILCESSGADNYNAFLAGLTAGETYYVRVYANYAFNGVANRINFNICVLTPPVPANDECAASVDISNGTQVNGILAGATQSLAAGNCATGPAYDVWYLVTPSRSGTLTVTTVTTDFNLVLEAYTGTCGALTSIACRNVNSGGETLSLEDAVAGTAYYLRVYSSSTQAQGRVAAETGNFTIQAVLNNPLPVTLVSFRVNPGGEEKSALLTWSTASETNSSHFAIERSADAKTWESVGVVKAKGRSTGLVNYSFMDRFPSFLASNGQVYYRLKMVDEDGSYTYSRTQYVSVETPLSTAVIYPNPATRHIHVGHVDPSAIHSIALYNTMGGRILHANRVPDEGIRVSELPAGIYTVKITGVSGETVAKKVVIRQ